MENHLILILASCCMMTILPAWTFPTQALDTSDTKQNVSDLLPAEFHAGNNDTSSTTIPVDGISSSTHKPNNPQLPITSKPYSDDNIPEETSTSQEPLTPAAQNYFTTYFQPHIPPLGHSRPYYQATEEPFIAKFITQPRQKQYLQHPRLQSYSTFDPTLMGSGDFGILRGGTFYSNEESSYHQEDNSDYYYSSGSDGHSESVTEGFIHRYTYPEEQFAQFRDFAELNTPADAAFSQYVVVYAAKNSTNTSSSDRKVPNNIFDQLQQIDEENAEAAKKRRADIKGLSSTKLKLIKTKIIKKKLVNKPKKSLDDDPLLALS